MNKTDIKPNEGSTKERTRKGRGNASGHGGECGRGHKGQRSRSGFSQMAGFEGGQMPLYRRIPKKNGFFNFAQKEVVSFNVDQVQYLAEKSGQDTIDLTDYLTKTQKGKNALVKVLGNGELKKPLTIKAHAFSKSALEKIESAKGKAETL